ncbi:hypothetical protein [Kocuria rosea]|jgi:hypothetical protein|uniref:Uncharacterized protein n=1 Tax=Kocuria rosea subsp. polaris TaxID=136273 RepID=A0A0A6VV37_KOCRO|nr:MULTISPECIES: hypothetical protein [Kocuria]KHD98451.1 hypothetical protein GY22_05295 [Kocuria polaris]
MTQTTTRTMTRTATAVLTAALVALAVVLQQPEPLTAALLVVVLGTGWDLRLTRELARVQVRP